MGMAVGMLCLWVWEHSALVSVERPVWLSGAEGVACAVLAVLAYPGQLWLVALLECYPPLPAVASGQTSLF